MSREKASLAKRQVEKNNARPPKAPVVERAILPMDWTPRGYQSELWQALRDGALRADVVAHRRWGKDEVALHWTAACASKHVGNYWHLLPELGQARRAIWDAVNPHTGKRRIDEAFPREFRKRTLDGDMKIELVGGSTWQLAGSDNHDGLVGSSPRGVVFSEWSLAKPDAWTYVRPILLENDGWALFLWTPRGRNHAARSFDSRDGDPAWFTLRHPATQTDVFTKDQLDREKRELIAELGSVEEGAARYASEYMVDFDAAAPGAYYATLLSASLEAGRIGRVPFDPALRVDTAWDLGIDDYTAVWFFQQVGKEVRAIDYYETSGAGLDSIVREGLSGKGYVYGTHHLPHDVMVRELGTGRSRYDSLGTLGLSGISVGRAISPEERVNAGRLMIPLTWFDAERCAKGLERLRGYRKKWSRATLSYAGPLHDQASHGADAFGEFALNRRGAVVARPEPRRGVHAGPLSWMG